MLVPSGKMLTSGDLAISIASDSADLFAAARAIASAVRPVPGSTRTRRPAASDASYVAVCDVAAVGHECDRRCLAGDGISDGAQPWHLVAPHVAGHHDDMGVVRFQGGFAVGSGWSGQATVPRATTPTCCPMAPAWRRALPTRRVIPASVPPSMTVAPVTVSTGIRTSANRRSQRTASAGSSPLAPPTTTTAGTGDAIPPAVNRRLSASPAVPSGIEMTVISLRRR